MTWEIHDCGNALVVYVTGRMVAAGVPNFREDVANAMEKNPNVLFDLTNMTHIDSSGLGALVQILQKSQAKGGKVVLSGLQPAPKVVFDITKVSRVFEIVPRPEDALFPVAADAAGGATPPEEPK